MIGSISRRGALGLFCASVLTACGGGGSESKTDVKVETTTKGQRLTDLKKALDAGAISQEEYEKERKKILEE
jgi:hypothetical protein